MESYQNLSDEELIQRLRNGDAGIMDYILDKYKPLVRKKANAMFLIGGDTDDLICLRQSGITGRRGNPLFFILQNCASQGRFTVQWRLPTGKSMHH